MRSSEPLSAKVIPEAKSIIRRASSGSVLIMFMITGWPLL
jgi:hypothetical protein